MSIFVKMDSISEVYFHCFKFLLSLLRLSLLLILYFYCFCWHCLHNFNDLNQIIFFVQKFKMLINILCRVRPLILSRCLILLVFSKKLRQLRIWAWGKKLILKESLDYAETTRPLFGLWAHERLCQKMDAKLQTWKINKILKVFLRNFQNFDLLSFAKQLKWINTIAYFKYNIVYYKNLGTLLSGGVVVLPLTSHAKDWVFKPSLRQAVQATKLWLVEALIKASKVTRVHSGLGLRLPMLQQYSCSVLRKDRGRNAQEKGIGTSTTSLLGLATFLLY